MGNYKASLIGFFLGLAAVIVGAFVVTAWFVGGASSVTTLIVGILAGLSGALACSFHLWKRTGIDQ